MVNYTNFARLFIEIFTDSAATNTVFDPKLTNVFVAIGKRSVIAEGVGEVGGVKV